MAKTYNIERLIDLGASRWTKYGKDRLYLRHFIMDNLDYKIDKYNTGNIRYAEIKGSQISNSMANKLWTCFENSYIDLATGKIYADGQKEEEAIELIEELLEEVEKATEEETEEKEEGEEEMTTMQEIKKMTGKELADFMTSEQYEGVTEGLYFQPIIEGHTVGYTLGVDNKGIIQKALELGYLKDEEVGDLDELSEDEILELAEIYYDYEEEIDKSLVETMRDEIIEELEENLQEVKDEE